MKIEIEIPESFIADQLVSAVEGGSVHWCRRLYRVDTITTIVGNDDHSAFYLAPLRGGEWKVEEIEPNGSITPRPVNYRTLMEAMHTMALKYPKHFGDLMNEQGDAITGDIVLQLAVFGELVYVS
jgi:hypothetical protein